MKPFRITLAALLILSLSFGALAECHTEFHDDSVTITLPSRPAV